MQRQFFARAMSSATSSTRIAFSERLVGSAVPAEGVILFCHATGFCKEVWRPVIEELDVLLAKASTSAIVVCVDMTGHGDSFARETAVDPRDWAENCVADVGEVLDRVADTTKGRRVLGVGHSMGGAALLLGDAAGLGPFDKLVVFEPIVPPFSAMRWEEPAADDHNLLAKLAAKRRYLFPDKAIAREYFMEKPLFKSWDARAVDAYVDGGLIPTHLRYTTLPEDALGVPAMARRVCLKCDRGFEAETFRGGHDGWDRLPTVSADTMVVAGAKTNVFDAFAPSLEVFQGMAERIPKQRFLVMDGCGHLGPMERPATFARLIAERCFSGLLPPLPRL